LIEKTDSTKPEFRYDGEASYSTLQDSISQLVKQ
jgi:hypothetical protein